MSRLRQFQTALKNDIYTQWNLGYRNVLGVLPTGGGKSVLTGDIMRESNDAAVVAAHRGELVSQLSRALAAEGVRHRIIGPDSLRRDCISLQLAELGRSYHDPGSRVAVAGVDTLVKRDVSHDSWFRQVKLWVQDEAHHVQQNNKWGKIAGMFPNARGLGFTATPVRMGASGLGVHSGGVFDAMAVGPTGRELIHRGFLTDYRIFAPPSDVNYKNVGLSVTGDYSMPQLRAAVHASNRIVGDVITHYLRIAPGKLGITFAVDVEAAQELAQAYRAAGVPAEVVSAKTPTLLRAQILRRFRNRELLQLVNVDLFGEGFDLPAIEVVSMVRKTESFSLFSQQFGRALRLMVAPELSAVWDSFTDEQRLSHIATSEKPRALIIDHVDNTYRHGLPDVRNDWTLDGVTRRSRSSADTIPVRTCANPNANGAGIPCLSVYERYRKHCPYCGFYPEPVARNNLDLVDGDLHELDAATLAKMRGEIDRIDGAPLIPGHLEGVAAAGARNQHLARQQAQGHLRNVIALWAGWQQHLGRDDSEAQRIFYHRYGVAVATAMTLGKSDAEKLQHRITDELKKHQVVSL
jgi:superfamily II DNA or RNA helicase